MLLLLVALVVFNLVIGPQLPNKLDVTETGFYSLASGSVEFIQRMPEPVTAYVILPDNRRRYEDIRRLLQNAQDRSNGKFTTKYINPTTNVSEYRTLAGKYPMVEANEYGVFLTVGEDEKRHSFIRDDEFTQTERGSPMNPQPPSESFVGESRLLRELLFLVEGDKKAVVYFTQSAGELDIGDGPSDSPTARVMKEYLTRNYLDVRPLKFEGPAPKVPDDAAVVIIAEPRFPIPAAHAAALSQYMTEPRGGKKGKLIVLAGAQFGPKEKCCPPGWRNCCSSSTCASTTGSSSATRRASSRTPRSPRRCSPLRPGKRRTPSPSRSVRRPCSSVRTGAKSPRRKTTRRTRRSCSWAPCPADAVGWKTSGPKPAN